MLSKIKSMQFQGMAINQNVFSGSWYFLSDNSVADFFDFEFYRIKAGKRSGVIITFFPKLGRWAWLAHQLQEQAFCFVCQNGESQSLLKKPHPAGQFCNVRAVLVCKKHSNNHSSCVLCFSNQFKHKVWKGNLQNASMKCFCRYCQLFYCALI